jgi:hypothetical protein
LEIIEYQLQEKENTYEIIAIRQYWGKEEKIAQLIKNAITITIMDHMFLMPITTKAPFIPKEPSVIVNGIYHRTGDSCSKCINRLQKVTEGCTICVFEISEKEEKTFDRETLKKEIAAESTQLNILELMEKKNIYEIYHLYHFKNFYDREMPLTVETFAEFIEMFGAEVIFRSKKELFIKKNKELYHTYAHSGFIEKELYRRTRIDLEQMKKETENELKEENAKWEFLVKEIKKIN